MYYMYIWREFKFGGVAQNRNEYLADINLAVLRVYGSPYVRYDG